MYNNYQLKSLIKRVIDNRGKTPPLSSTKTNFPLVEVSSIRGYSRYPQREKFGKWITEETYNGWFRSGHPKKKDILTSTVGSIGEFSQFDGTGSIAQNIIGLQFDETICLSDFAYYLFTYKKNIQRVKNLDISSVQPSVRVPHLLELEFKIPPLANQKAIAHILGTLDEKIELNKKKSPILEEIAKATFKSWFIKFDPVRAKAEGRPTGLPPEISDLFPDELVESEIGKVPKGWVVTDLGQLVTPRRGKAITKRTRTKGIVPVVAAGLEPAYFHNESNVNAPVVMISASGTNAGFARLYHQNIWASDDCLFISKMQSPTPCLWYIFLKLNQSKIYNMQQGAAQPHIYTSDLVRLQICIPKEKTLWNILNEFASLLFEKIGVTTEENRVLSELRDTLLPKLISEELNIHDAEKFLEAVGV